MQYIDRQYNIERVFEVRYDEEALRILLNELIEESSYKIVSNLGKMSKKEIQKAKEDVDYIRMPNDDNRYKFTKNSDGTISKINTVSPELSYILFEILHNRESAIYNLYDYINHSDFDDIDAKINNIQEEIKNLKRHESDRKRQLLTNLKVLCLIKKEHYYFDTDILRDYYNKVLDYISFHLISEKRIFTGEETYKFDTLRGGMRLRRKQICSDR